MRVDATSYDDAVDRILTWAKDGESRYVCVASVNNVIHTRDDRSYRKIMLKADLVTPDGMPLVWSLRLFGLRDATRVYGPELTPALCAGAAEKGIPIALYGATPEVLAKLRAYLEMRFPGISIALSIAPPFRALTDEEEERDIAAINSSGARVVLVGISTPKQERLMAGWKGRVDAVMVGVGAAFDFLSGEKHQAPRFMQRAGLEWLFRLATEPKRLWRRYLVGNPRFLMLLVTQLLSTRGNAGTEEGR
jgi:N-acetylglucosaminyldiphosphoundecaprenol N-acetyl-beta-D-mannosaminyltransferase